MRAIVDFLTKSEIQYMATVGVDGKPKVRPFQFMFDHDQKIWFCTSNQKEVYKELMNQPFVELCASGEKMSWLRLSGRVVFTDNLLVKKKVFEVSPLVKSIYKTPDNPNFEVFYLEEVTATISRIGEKPAFFKW